MLRLVFTSGARSAINVVRQKTRWLNRIHMVRSNMRCTLICWRTSMKSQQIPRVQCRESGMTRRQLEKMGANKDGLHG
jgi:hypothetical protein